MISSMLVVFLASLVTDVRSDQECSFRSDAEAGYKASWVYDAQNKRVQFAIEAKQRLADNSWTGIGFGRTMNNGDMIVIANSGGRLSVSDRHGTGYSEPAVDAQQDAQNFVGKVENGIVYATFDRLVNTNDRDDKPLEDAALNNCQYFMFPTSGGSTTANGDPSKVTLEQHINTPTTRLICNISRCTGGGEGQQPAAAGAGPALSNNVLGEEVARDSVVSNRSHSPRPGQAGADGRTTPAAGSQAGRQGGATVPGAAGAGQGSTSGSEGGVAGGRTPAPAGGPNAPGGTGSDAGGPGARTSPTAAGGAAGGAEASPGSGSIPGCEYVDGKYKIQWYYTEATKRLTFTLTTPLPPSRWAGVGFGQQMQNGDMIVIQDNNGVKATDRHGTGHVEPVLDAHQDIEAFKGVVTGGILQATFNRLLNTNDKDDLPIDDEAQNNCQYFIFPVTGGNVDEQGKLQVHDSTPKVKLICNAKSCKKPADTATGAGGATGAAGAPPGASEGGTGETPTTGTTPGVGGVGPAGSGGAARPGGLSPAAGAGGQSQPGSTAAGEAQGAGGAAGAAGQPVGGQPTTGGRQPGGQQPGGEAGGQSAGGQSAGGQPGGQSAGGQPGAAGSSRGAGEAGGTQTQGQSGAEAAAGPQPQCPVRKDHHLCAGYIDDYLSVVYSRFPKTDVITQKACNLLATTQDYIVLRECCHYLLTQCTYHVYQNIRGLAATGGVGDASASSGGGGNAAAGAATTSSPSGGAGAGNAGVGAAGRGGPSIGSVSTPPTGEQENAAASNSPGGAQASTPASVVGGASISGPNISAGQNPNPALTPDRNSAPNAADRGPEIQPAAPSAHTGTAQNPAPASAAAPNSAPASGAAPNSPEGKSGGVPPSSAGKRPLPNDPTQPDAGSKPGARP